MDTIIFCASVVSVFGLSAWIIRASFKEIENRIKRMEEATDEEIKRAYHMSLADAKDYAATRVNRLASDLSDILREEQRKKQIKICNDGIAEAESTKSMYTMTLKDLKKKKNG